MSFIIGAIRDAAMRGGFAKIINRVSGFRCIAEYGSAEAAIEGIPANPSDIVLMDINLPGLSGVDCVCKLKPLLPAVDFVMLTMFGDRDRIFDALRAGAVGYLLKSDTSVVLIDAIRQVRAGGSPMSPEIARHVILYFRHSAPEPKPGDAALETLREREREILKLLAGGLQYREIGSSLNISIDTVRSHIRNIYEKLQVHSRAEASAKFFGR
ncbi:MAG: response regulator transcription factor [Luteolibacter sp.]